MPSITKLAVFIAALASNLAQAAPGQTSPNQSAPGALTIPLFNGSNVVQAGVEPSAGNQILDTYSCSGSSLCGHGLGAGDCDAAYRVIDRNHRYFTGSGATQTGVCYGKCGIFVEGGNCDLNGSEMIDGYNELRQRGCKICGNKTYNDGCRLTINYVTGC
ncbi:hypothetical protein McanMca71_001159 [Microsporum canis]|uniref:Uncharacterized protein n=1 Tax=Arthroderma otae (strain ATCC MYA-4605 / CBS 113480) TaxID=554155 RepID=C5FHM9_ARTOC|nr:conserved hypothetical protein [Microsporum canis CBS 113480]EEQ28769.1 conserved hypothetical protein [Microsporum canis CBS 113480]